MEDLFNSIFTQERIDLIWSMVQEGDLRWVVRFFLVYLIAYMTITLWHKAKGKN